MDSESILSRQTLALGQCARPIASKLRRHMQSRPNRSERVTDILSFVHNHLEQIGANVGQFTDELNQLGRLVAAANSPENAVHRGSARMEIRLERLLDGYDEVRRAGPGLADSEGARLLEKVYCDTFEVSQAPTPWPAASPPAWGKTPLTLRPYWPTAASGTTPAAWPGP